MQSRQIDHPIYIDTSETLQRFCGQWAHASVLALDTEFIRTDTFYPIGALIQVSDGTGCFLIDPLAIDDFSAFKALLVDPNIIKVLHSCSEDLEVFDCLFGVLPVPLIDTQIAAGLDGLGFSLGYQAMTDALLQIHVAKGETRSNWLQRPLTDSQIHYAALDVAYLPEMYQMLTESLQTKGRLPWLQEECTKQTDQFGATDAISHYYKKVKSAWKLSAAELGVLQILTQWREEKARELDRPRGRVIKDRCCFDMARVQPQSIKALSAIEELGHKTIRNNGDEILALIKQGQSLDAAELPQRLPKPLPPANGTIMKRLKSHVSHRAEQLNMAQELLVKKRDYEALLRSGFDGGNYQLPPTLSGWRKAVIGDALIDILEKENR
ncbi:MAG TPA: ribonuclease D [Porticoccus sp.]|nr:ribonuclease D [Porticoccus sp.]